MNMRENLEQQEQLRLSPKACLASQSRGRLRQEEECQVRTCFQRDTDRIVYCKSFRRLKHKTQVFLSPEGDHYRTRLTHTLEVSQIARSMARALSLNEDLAEAAAYRADLCILTADNPANEPVMDVIREIDSYFPADGCPRLWEPDREAAIRSLVQNAEAGDVILLAGKGHETYQIIGTEKRHFDDREVLAEAFQIQN